METTLHRKTEMKMDDMLNETDNSDDNNDDNVGNCWWLSGGRTEGLFLYIAIFAILIRVMVSLGSYSGAGNPPRFGDYEAQRHWMEITINLPANEWYKNSTYNDLAYWGLDYPPLTAYQSYVHGLILQHFHPDSVFLFSSRGQESYLGKILMRWTVLSSDILVFFPSVFYFIVSYYKNATGARKNDMMWHIAVILLNPCLILIDHGHFQFNCISLGLTVGAVAAILSGKDIIASILYCLALNHKQMSAYYAPAFFSYLLGKSMRRKNPVFEVVKLSLVVIGTFTVVWWPYLHSFDSLLAVLRRLAPFERGIYEDYVANFWCTTSAVIKWKALFTTEWLKVLSSCATVVAFLPSLVHQIRFPSTGGFLYAMLNTSFSFYFFSFQVHEKSILLPLLPAGLLWEDEQFLHDWLTLHAMLSVFPLLCRDGLSSAYVALLVVSLVLAHWRGRRPWWAPLAAPLLASAALHTCRLLAPPPPSLPFLFDSLIMMLSFSQFFLLSFYSNFQQWRPRPPKYKLL